MQRMEKEQIVEELARNLSECSIVIATDYRGLSAKDMVDLRKKLREQGIEYKVAKNTLTRFAAEKADKEQFKTLLEGPLAMAFGYDDDVTKSAKVINDFVKATGSVMKIKGGMLGSSFLSASDVVSLASIPSREVLIARVVGQMAAPIQALHNVLSSPLRGLAYVLQARVQQAGGE